MTANLDTCEAALAELRDWLVQRAARIADPQSPPLIVLISGSRTWSRISVMRQALELLPARCHIRAGAARGADKLAVQIWAWLGRDGVEEFPVPGEAWRVSRRAGHHRNIKMVLTQPQADLCLVFQRDASNGAGHCGHHAELAGIDTIWFRYTTGG